MCIRERKKIDSKPLVTASLVINSQFLFIWLNRETVSPVHDGTNGFHFGVAFNQRKHLSIVWVRRKFWNIFQTNGSHSQSPSKSSHHRKVDRDRERGKKINKHIFFGESFRYSRLAAHASQQYPANTLIQHLWMSKLFKYTLCTQSSHRGGDFQALCSR